MAETFLGPLSETVDLEDQANQDMKTLSIWDYWEVKYPMDDQELHGKVVKIFEFNEKYVPFIVKLFFKDPKITQLKNVLEILFH